LSRSCRRSYVAFQPATVGLAINFIACCVTPARDVEEIRRFVTGDHTTAVTAQLEIAAESDAAPVATIRVTDD
jgi:hypothetical protein